MSQKPALYIGSQIYRRASFGENHPLSYARQGSVQDMCRILGWLGEGNYINSAAADVQTLTRYHDAAYVEALRAADVDGKVSKEMRARYNFGTMENPLFKGVFNRASTTVGGSILAAQKALGGKCVFHPSGGTHHGQKDKASGFCYFNDPVFAILTFLDAGLERVLYLDIDAHHGDGVESAFTDDGRVTTLSIHEEKRWPYSGSADDQGGGRINASVPTGLNDREFAHIIEALVLPYCERWSPQAVVITCGADALAADPLSKMGLSNGALWDAVEAVREVIPTCVVLGGGGYNPWTTVRCWAGLWGRLSGRDMPQTLPLEAQAILAKFDSDLIDEEDRDRLWLTALQDKPNNGPIRESVIALTRVLYQRHIAG